MSDYIHWKEFAGDALIADIREITLRNRHAFIDSTVTTNEADFRKSKVLFHHNFQELYDKFTTHLLSFLPYFKAAFPQLPDDPAIELQITSHGDGEYFKRHTDNGSEETGKRLVTYVYYYTLADQQRFTGGELILETPTGIFHLAPTHNTLIVFPSKWWHEVNSVFVPSMQWEDGRLTINGWFREKTVDAGSTANVADRANRL